MILKITKIILPLILIFWLAEDCFTQVEYEKELNDINEILEKTNDKEEIIDQLSGMIIHENYDYSKEIPVLMRLLRKTDDFVVKQSITKKIGEIGSGAKETIPYLFELDEESDPYESGAIDAIGEILDDLAVNNDLSSNEIIIVSFEKYRNEFNDLRTKKIESKIRTLKDREKLQNLEKSSQVKDFIANNLYTSIVIASILLLFISWAITLWLKPILLILFYEKFFSKSPDIKVKDKIELPIAPLAAIICLKPRALDAWINLNLNKAMANFETKETVLERKLYIPVNVSFNNQKASFDTKKIREVFDKNQSQLLIYGDGGSGKTSLVCQIAHWAMSGELFSNRIALPVLVENNVLDIQKAISEELKKLSDNENKISDGLQKELLRKKRIMLIVDGLSELNEETKQQVLNNPDINAVVYTSRNDEIKDISKIETNNLVGGMVIDFLSDYIEKSIGKEEKERLFDKTIFDYNSGDLKKLAGEKEISVLMAKLYAEQMIAQKQGGINNGLPNNVPDLMIQSIRVLHEKEIYKKLEFSEVVKVSKIVANESLKQDYRPISAIKDEVKKALEIIKNGEAIFCHLRDSLKIIEEKGIAEDKIAFKLDPLAEYLAASYLVEKNKDDAKKWNAFLKDAKRKSGEKNNIKGFLVAVKDCYEMDENVDQATVQKLTKIIENQTDM